jgi:hypothetical protein
LIENDMTFSAHFLLCTPGSLANLKKMPPLQIHTIVSWKSCHYCW